MSTLMLCGSPHDEGGNSVYFLKGLSDRLGGDTEIYNTVKSPQISEAAFLETVRNGGNVVFSFPLYADSLPAYFLGFLQRLEKAVRGIVSDSHVYIIVNNGFYDSLQNNIAVKTMWNWCGKCGLQKGRAVAIGAGGMAQAAPIGKGPMAKVGGALETLAEDIQNKQFGDTIFVEPSFPRFLYKIAGNMGFRAQMKKSKEDNAAK